MSGLSRLRRIPRVGAASSHRLRLREASGGSAERLFGRIRVNLTLWFSGVIAVALILSGIILYLAVQQSLLGDVNSSLEHEVIGPGQLAASWQSVSGGFSGTHVPCFDERLADEPVLIACYDSNGNLTAATRLAQGLPAFLHHGGITASGDRGSFSTISSSGRGDAVYSTIQAFTVAVPGSNGGLIGYIRLGYATGSQTSTLNTLLRLLLILGACTILFAFGLGLFLANRALAPARLAHARQRDFIADASHELRTPLTMLRTSVELVLRGRNHLPVDDVALLEDTVEEAAHLTALANNMLSLARLDSNVMRIEEDVCDLAAIASEAVRWAGPLADDKNVTIQTNLDGAVPVLSDPLLIQQSVLILLDNAIKYNRPGGTVSVSAAALGDQARIQVVDSGIGIAASDMSRLGERFYRVDKARSREFGGAGLGLSIVRSIATRLGGHFDIESVPGQGTSASLTFTLLASVTKTEPAGTTLASESTHPEVASLSGLGQSRSE